MYLRRTSQHRDRLYLNFQGQRDLVRFALALLLQILLDLLLPVLDVVVVKSLELVGQFSHHVQTLENDLVLSDGGFLIRVQSLSLIFVGAVTVELALQKWITSLHVPVTHPSIETFFNL